METSSFGSNELLDLQENNFILAFGIIDYYTNKPLADPKYVEWNVHIDDFRENIRKSSQKLKTKVCDEKDLKNLY